MLNTIIIDMHSMAMNKKEYDEKSSCDFSPTPPCNFPDPLLSCHRIHDPGQHQPGHRGTDSTPTIYSDIATSYDTLTRSRNVKRSYVIAYP